jgi:hypothetical protein
MSFFENSLEGKRIDSVYVDSEVTYMILSDGTQVTIHGFVMVEPGSSQHVLAGGGPADQRVLNG